MSLIKRLYNIIEECRAEAFADFSQEYRLICRCGKGENKFALGDNLNYMKHLLNREKMACKINLIYIDPPFYSKSNYGCDIKLRSDKVKNVTLIKQKAYKDVWEDGMEEYLRMITKRLFLAKELLAEDGCLWVHLDWHVVHYVKIIMDEIFGEKNFVNEVIWNYKSGGVSKRYFARKHDTLLFYSKSDKYYFKPQLEKSYNRDFKPYRFKGVKEYQDEVGWYTMVNMKDVWQINMVGRTSVERTGYATQKPEQLLARIIESCTKEGDLCADFFGGSGTLAKTADSMNRKWITCDAGRLSALNIQKRLCNSSINGYEYYEEKSIEEENGVLKISKDYEKGTFGKEIISLKILGYKPHSIENKDIDIKHYDGIKEMIEKDSVSLIDYWCIDLNYDGTLFKPSLHFCRKNNELDFSIDLESEKTGTIAIRCIDIFGNSSLCVLQ